MNHLRGQAKRLSNEALAGIQGGMYPYRPQAGPVYDRSIDSRALMGQVGGGFVTGGLAGRALGGFGFWPGAIGGGLLGGINYTVDRMINPTQVLPAMPFSVCHGPGYTPRPAGNPQQH
ncbi:MAG TPA: hypothetical protein VK188_13540 [Holophaga sp.]|nr:hypothetical protein [Holophaga sp.]